ncbi:MAG: hypothetical protein MK207_07080 [Saprospiraceae bacterium]|nr:hypothetical protein [Saprospiraceae bacterium]
MATKEEKIKKMEEELKSLNKTLVQYGDYFNQDGEIDDQEQAHLNTMMDTIKRAEAKLAAIKKQMKVSVKVGVTNKGEDGTTKVGVEVDSDGNVKGTAEAKTKGGVKGTVEVTSDKIKMAVGKEWKLPSKDVTIPIVKATPATFMLGIDLTAGVNGKAGISADNLIDFKEGQSTIGINATGSITGWLELAGVAAIIRAGGRGDLTAAVKGRGELVWNGTDLKANASITGSLTTKFSAFIGLSNDIISAASNFGVSRSDLTYYHPLGGLELLVFTGVKIEDGKITGTPELKPGKDIVKIQNAFDQAVKDIKAVWDTISGAFDDAYKLIDGSVQYWQKHGVIGTLEDFAKELEDYVDDKIEGTVVGDAKDFWKEKGIVGGLEEFGNEVGDLWDSLWD